MLEELEEALGSRARNKAKTLETLSAKFYQVEHHPGMVSDRTLPLLMHRIPCLIGAACCCLCTLRVHPALD